MKDYRCDLVCMYVCKEYSCHQPYLPEFSNFSENWPVCVLVVVLVSHYAKSMHQLLVEINKLNNQVPR